MKPIRKNSRNSNTKSNMGISLTFKPYKPKEGELCTQFYKQVLILQAYNQIPNNIKIFHIANESLSSAAYTKKLLGMGMMPGIADYGVNIKDPRGGRIAYLEFKRDKSCKQTQSQKEFQAHCEEFYIPYVVKYTVEDAIEWLKSLTK